MGGSAEVPGLLGGGPEEQSRVKTCDILDRLLLQGFSSSAPRSPHKKLAAFCGGRDAVFCQIHCFHQPGLHFPILLSLSLMTIT